MAWAGSRGAPRAVPKQAGRSGGRSQADPRERGFWGAWAQAGSGGASGRAADRPSLVSALLPSRREVTGFRPGVQGRMGPAAGARCARGGRGKPAELCPTLGLSQGLPTAQRESQTCFRRRVSWLHPYSHISWTPFLLGGFPPGVSDSKESACSTGDLG